MVVVVVVAVLVLVLEGEGWTIPLIFPTLPTTAAPETGTVVVLVVAAAEEREVTLDMEKIEARSRNSFLLFSFLLGLVTTTVPAAKTLPVVELPPPSSADDLDWSAGSGDCWPDIAEPSEPASSNTITAEEWVGGVRGLD